MFGSEGRIFNILNNKVRLILKNILKIFLRPLSFPKDDNSKKKRCSVLIRSIFFDAGKCSSFKKKINP